MPGLDPFSPSAHVVVFVVLTPVRYAPFVQVPPKPVKYPVDTVITAVIVVEDGVDELSYVKLVLFVTAVVAWPVTDMVSVELLSDVPPLRGIRIIAVVDAGIKNVNVNVSAMYIYTIDTLYFYIQTTKLDNTG